MSERRLRIGVPGALTALAPYSAHGKMWYQVLRGLAAHARLVPVDNHGRPLRRIHRGPLAVMLADGHADLPATQAPLVVQVHEAGWFDPALRDLLSPEFYEYIAPRTERAVRAAADVITPSQAARRDVIEAYGLDPARVHAVAHGVDPVFSPAARGGRELVARAAATVAGIGTAPGRDTGAARDLATGAAGSPEPPPYVLYVASLHPRKNLAVLREAMVEIARSGFPHLLAIAGRPAPDRADSSDLERAAAAELPGFPGRVVRLEEPSDRELAALMAGSDAFCLPSLYEGFGLTALEAMACGTPVIVSDRGALPEVVGDTGIVVAPTADAVAAALQSVLGDPERARTLASAGSRRARTFTWERTAAGWLAVLRAAAAQSRVAVGQS